ncbi:hypothetical protein KUCAC02_004601, partial [Chaenocephalus aceratus]
MKAPLLWTPAKPCLHSFSWLLDKGCLEYHYQPNGQGNTEGRLGSGGREDFWSSQKILLGVSLKKDNEPLTVSEEQETHRSIYYDSEYSVVPGSVIAQPGSLQIKQERSLKLTTDCGK